MARKRGASESIAEEITAQEQVEEEALPIVEAVEQALEAPEPDPPTADIVMDAATATAWMKNASLRKVNTYSTVRFEGAGMDKNVAGKAAFMACLAVRNGGTIYVKKAFRSTGSMNNWPREQELFQGYIVLRKQQKQK